MITPEKKSKASKQKSRCQEHRKPLYKTTKILPLPAIASDLALFKTAEVVGDYPKPLTVNHMCELAQQAVKSSRDGKKCRVIVYYDFDALHAMVANRESKGSHEMADGYPSVTFGSFISADNLCGKMFAVYEDANGKRFALCATVNTDLGEHSREI